MAFWKQLCMAALLAFSPQALEGQTRERLTIEGSAGPPLAQLNWGPGQCHYPLLNWWWIRFWMINPVVGQNGGVGRNAGLDSVRKLKAKQCRAHCLSQRNISGLWRSGLEAKNFLPPRPRSKPGTYTKGNIQSILFHIYAVGLRQRALSDINHPFAQGFK